MKYSIAEASYRSEKWVRLEILTFNQGGVLTFSNVNISSLTLLFIEHYRLFSLQIAYQSIQCLMISISYLPPSKIAYIARVLDMCWPTCFYFHYCII